jgi:hypothetical protein
MNSKQNLIQIGTVWGLLLLLILAIGVLRGASRRSEVATDTEDSMPLKARLFKKPPDGPPHPSSKKRDYIRPDDWVKGMRIYRDWLPKRQTAIYIAEMDRNAKNVRFGAELANGRVLGREKISGMAKHRADAGKTPILAAVNAGFGIREDGRGRGGMFFNLHIQDWELVTIPPRRNRWGYSPPSPWGETSIGVTTKGEFLIDAVELNGVITLNGEELKVECINQICDSSCPAMIYTPRFGSDTLARRTFEVTLTQLELPLTGKYRSRFVVESIEREGNSPIPPDGVVLALDDRVAQEWRSKFEEGATGELKIALLPEKWQQVPDGVGGDVRLLRDGEIEPELEEFHRTRGGSASNYRNGAALHPRSAMGFNDDSLFLMTVDGRQAGYSMGMTFYEMAEFLRDLGATHAVNLDGGSSSTMWGLGGVINRPSHGYERRVFNVAMITLRKEKRKKP